LSSKDVHAKLTAAGLHGTNGFAQSSLDVPKGGLLSTRPPLGSKVRKGSTVTLIYSSGPAIAPVPLVIGKPQAEAVRLLRDAGFIPTVKSRFSDSVAEGAVVDQSPRAQVKLEQGSKVTIFVSQGPRPITLKDYAGQPAASVEAALAGLGLTSGESSVYSTSVPKGNVVTTDPPAGTVVHHGDAVTVVVSLGPRTFPMPSVIGLPVGRARSELRRDGLVVVVIQIPGSTGSTVVSQIPTEGTIVQQGATVRIYIA
jgi:serine/threonine-protein kinase